jgi:hypothetical protein
MTENEMQNAPLLRLARKRILTRRVRQNNPAGKFPLNASGKSVF